MKSLVSENQRENNCGSLCGGESIEEADWLLFCARAFGVRVTSGTSDRSASVGRIISLPGNVHAGSCGF